MTMNLRISKAGLILSKSNTSPKISKKRQIITTKSSRSPWTDLIVTEMRNSPKKSKKPKND
jgi:hypothetical protein